MRGHGRGHTIIVRNVPTDFLPFCSLRLGAGVHHAKAVERGPGGDEQRLKISPAKADVGRPLRNGDLLELLGQDRSLDALVAIQDNNIFERPCNFIIFEGFFVAHLP